MAIKEFEYLHGTVLTKLLRKDEPLTLMLVETNKDESWSAYKITGNNEDNILYMKYSSSPRKTDKHYVWTFRFTSENLKEIAKIKESKFYLALICAQSDFSSKPAEICLLTKEEVVNGIDIESDISQSFTVFCESNKKLRVVGTRMNNEKYKVERDRIIKIVF